MAAVSSILGAAAIAASVGGGVMSSQSASKASKAQVNAANAATNVERQNFLDGLELVKPAYEAGDQARAAMLYELGIGPRPTFGASTSYMVGDQSFDTREAAQQYIDTRPPAALAGDSLTGLSALDVARFTGYSPSQLAMAEKNANYAILDEANALAGLAKAQGLTGGGGQAAAEPMAIREVTEGGTPYRGFEATPDYQYRLDESQRAIERSAASRGMQLSGATLKALQGNAQGLASQGYADYYNRLAALAGAGQTASQSAFAGFQNLGNSQANALMQAGNARASGFLNQGQAMQGALNGISSGIGFLAPSFGGGGAALSGLNLGGVGMGATGSLMGSFMPGGF